MKPTVFLYNFCNEKKLKIEQICLQTNTFARQVLPTEQHQKLNLILNDEVKKNQQEKYFFKEDMLIFSHFSDDLLDFFLQKMREAELSVPLKAVLTQSNREWTSFELNNELKKEYESFKKNKNK